MNLQTEADVQAWVEDKNPYRWIESKVAFGKGANLILSKLHELPEVKEMMIDFAIWLKGVDNGDCHYNDITGQTTESIGFSPWDCFSDNILSVSELVTRFLTQYTKQDGK